jgi:hypothetical protein
MVLFAAMLSGNGTPASVSTIGLAAVAEEIDMLGGYIRIGVPPAVASEPNTGITPLKIDGGQNEIRVDGICARF